MKRAILAMLLTLCISIPAQGCDVCGCSASNQFLGILPRYNYNFVGFQYQESSFSSDHPSLYEHRPNVHSRDMYATFQLWARYNVGKHYQVFAFVPYQYNRHTEDSANTKSSGIGDVSLLVNRIFIKKEGKQLSHLLIGGMGMKLPTGAHTGISELDKQGLPNMQPGTGSWDVITNANYTVHFKQVGINVDGAYTFTTPNRDNYKYGNRLNTGVMGFYSIPLKDWSLLPQVGIRYEYTLHDYDNYARHWLNEQSGGYLCCAAAGLQAYYKSIGVRLTYQLPLSQHYASGYVTANHKLETGIFFLF